MSAAGEKCIRYRTILLKTQVFSSLCLHFGSLSIKSRAMTANNQDENSPGNNSQNSGAHNESAWFSKTKTDLIIEVWEALDCESIGRPELEAIETAVIARFGASAVDQPMRVARLLADEGADLRHAEILELDVERRSEDGYAAAFRNLIKFSDLAQAETTFKNLENLRQKFTRDNDREGLRRLKEKVQQARERANMIARNKNVKPEKQAEKAEIAEWFKIWLENPGIFQSWLALRKNSEDFKTRFVKND